MDIQTAKQIRLEEYLHSLGYSPVKRQGINLWYKSPFREETEASFKVNTERNQWYDFALGKGGNIIALASHLYATDSVPYLLKRIEEQAPHVCPVSFSFRKQSFTEPSFQQLEIVPLSSPALLAYLQERGRFLPLPCSHICRKGESIRHWRKENAGKRGLRTTANGTSPLHFRTYRAAMRYATDISRAVSRRKTLPTYGSKENRRMHVTFSRDLWTTSHF